MSNIVVTLGNNSSGFARFQETGAFFGN